MNAKAVVVVGTEGTGYGAGCGARGADIDICISALFYQYRSNLNVDNVLSIVTKVIIPCTQLPIQTC